jgi:hypothetical protein
MLEFQGASTIPKQIQKPDKILMRDSHLPLKQSGHSSNNQTSSIDNSL